jgi:predicted nucleic acid-binding protein
MVVIDTNVLVYLLIAGDRTSKAQALFARDADWRSDVFVLIEFCNVLVTYLRAGSLRPAQAEGLLAEAERRMHSLIQPPHRQSLRIAQQFVVSAYDARFLAVAHSLGTKLITEDAKLRAAAPSFTLSLGEALSSD